MLLLWSALGLVVFLSLAVVFRGAPYVPSRRQDIERAFDHLYSVGPNDTVVDIGSGDGIVLRAAARRGARAIGFELNPFLVLLSRWLSRKQSKVSVRLADAWLSTVPSDTTLIYVFSTSRDIEKIGRWVDRQAGKVNKPLYLLSYGIKLARDTYRTHGPYHLYKITPLQSEKDPV